MPASAPVCVDLYAGLGGWSDGFLAEGYECIGFDVERHDYGSGGYPGDLVLQDVLTLHGSQFKDAACIVASPPCTEFSYMAMPWKRAKQIASALRGDGEFPEGYTGSRTIPQLTALFDACFRIQREASEAAGHHIPMVVENVKGAQPWVGRAKANFGSFFLWGDVESIGGRIVASRAVRFGADSTRAYRRCKPDGLPPLNGHDDPRRGRETANGSWFAMGANGKSNLRKENRNEETECAGGHFEGPDTDMRRVQRAEAVGAPMLRQSALRLPGVPGTGEAFPNDGSVADGRKVPMNEKTGKPGRSFQSAAVEGQKAAMYSDPRRNGGKGVHLTSPRENMGGVKQPGHSGRAWFADPDVAGHFSSKSSARKAASAQIAKIPLDLAQYIARCFKECGSEKWAAQSAEVVGASFAPFQENLLEV